MSKRTLAIDKLVDRSKKYPLDEACSLIKSLATAKFDESVNLKVKLGVDVKQSNQMIRGSVVLPHGTGKVPVVIVFCKGEKEKDAKDAGADFVGSQDLMDKISGGWTAFDVAISTPDMMKDLGKIGRILGPLGLMPNPKSGTVTQDISKSVKEAKTGRIEFKVDPGAVVNAVIGKASFEPKKLSENASVLMEAILKNKPSGIKGAFVQKVILSSSMGPGINIDDKPYQGI